MKIALIPGEGIGPEITEATLKVLDAVGFRPEWEVVELGEAAYQKYGDPLPRQLLGKLRKIGIALKGPLGTPDGAGYRSVNVALRKKLGLYANVRLVTHYLPKDARPWKGEVDIVVVRENTEDLYVGDERITAGTEQYPERALARKIITRAASAAIARFALAYAQKHGRRRITILHKANILKYTDGLFLDAAREALRDAGDIAVADMHIDAAGELLVKNPARFDVVLTTNLYGDFFSSTAAGLVGGATVVPGANFGNGRAVFEATHGTAPDIAGKNLGNPTGLMLSAAMMLEYAGEHTAAEKIRAAVRRTLRAGVRTGDLGGNATCMEYAAVVAQSL